MFLYVLLLGLPKKWVNWKTLWYFSVSQSHRIIVYDYLVDGLEHFSFSIIYGIFLPID